MITYSSNFSMKQILKERRYALYKNNWLENSCGRYPVLHIIYDLN